MKVLGLDTASNIASIAVVDDSTGVLAEQTSDTEGHRADLLLFVDATCKAAGVTASDLDAVAVGAGPGSFTGLRIGMATAKGIAFATGRPLWAVSSLAALAHAELSRDPSGTVVAVLDARRGEVYAGVYRRVDGRTIVVGDERVLPPTQVTTLATGDDVRYTGDAAAVYPELATLPGTWGVRPTGRAVAELALAGTRADILVGGAPSYIRPSEAEVKYPDGVPGAIPKPR